MSAAANCCAGSISHSPGSARTTSISGTSTTSTTRCRSTRRCPRSTPPWPPARRVTPGVSNYCGWRIARAATWQRSVPARAPIIANQVRYSLLERGIEREVVPACQALGVGVFPYSPLGGGVLTGKYRAGRSGGLAGGRNGRDLADIASERDVGIVEAVATAAEGLATSPIAVALCLGPRPAGHHGPDPGRPDARSAHGGAGVGEARSAGGDPARTR